MKHVIAIRMAYPSSLDRKVNQSRLKLTLQNCVRALARQTDRDFSIQLTVDESDPFLHQRLTEFELIGRPLLFDKPAELACITRMDDDDIIAPTFIERLKAANPTSGWYTFPEGYVRSIDGAIYRRRYVENQFVSRVCEPGQSVYAMKHTLVPNATVVDERPAWVWWKHPHSRTTTAKRPRNCYGEPLPQPKW